MLRKVEGEDREYAELREKIIGLLDAEEQRRVRGNAGAIAYITNKAIAISIGKKHQISADEAVKIYDQYYSDSSRCDLTVEENAAHFEKVCEKIEHDAESIEGRTEKTLEIMRRMKQIAQEEGVPLPSAAKIYVTEMVDGMADLTQTKHACLFRQLCNLYKRDSIF